MEQIKETCYKGTRILLGNHKRQLINKVVDHLESLDFKEIQIPIIQFEKYFTNKVGEENNNLMYTFTDRADRKLCLAPEYTSIIQELSKTTFKHLKDVKLFYIAECFRGEKPQAGRYRQFTQIGVEIINPTKDYMVYYINEIWLPNLSIDLCELIIGKEKRKNILLEIDVTRGLDYYKEGKGFQLEYSNLSSSKQICGGGEYEGGIGFAIGLDRLLTIL